MRVVLDTNVLVSALIFPGGAPEAVYRLALEGWIEPVTSRPLLAELARVIVDKFGWETQLAEEAVAQMARISAIVKPSVAVAEIEADPADDRVLEAALSGRAEAIVSGDRHLPRLKNWRGIRVLEPSVFLSQIS